MKLPGLPELPLLEGELRRQRLGHADHRNPRVLGRGAHRRGDGGDGLAVVEKNADPVLLDEQGLESTLDWYIPMVERQTGLKLHYEKSGAAFPVDGAAGV